MYIREICALLTIYIDIETDRERGDKKNSILLTNEFFVIFYLSLFIHFCSIFL